MTNKDVWLVLRFLAEFGPRENDDIFEHKIERVAQGSDYYAADRIF